MPHRDSSVFSWSQFICRVPIYFAGIMPIVALLSAFQYLTLHHMPGWSTTVLMAPRLLSLEFVPTRKFVVATRLNAPSLPLTGTKKELFLIRDRDLKLVGTFELEDTHVAKLSTCGRFLATYSHEGTLCVSQIELPNFVRRHTVLALGEYGVREIVWSPDSSMMLVLGDCRIWLWSRIDDRFVCSIDVDYNSEILVPAERDCFGFSQDGKYRLASWRTGEFAGYLPIGLESRFINPCKDNKRIAYLTGRVVQVLDVENRRPLLRKRYETAKSVANGMAFSPDGKQLAIIQDDLASGGCGIRVIDVLSEEVLFYIPIDHSFVGVRLVDGVLWSWTLNGLICKWNIGQPPDCLSQFRCPDTT